VPIFFLFLVCLSRFRRPSFFSRSFVFFPISRSVFDLAAITESNLPKLLDQWILHETVRSFHIALLFSSLAFGRGSAPYTRGTPRRKGSFIDSSVPARLQVTSDLRSLPSFFFQGLPIDGRASDSCILSLRLSATPRTVFSRRQAVGAWFAFLFQHNPPLILWIRVF